MSAGAKTLWMPHARAGFEARQARQRFLHGMSLAKEAATQAARFEANWQKTVSDIPFWHRCWIAALIVLGKWGTYRGSGSAEPRETAPKEQATDG